MGKKVVFLSLLLLSSSVAAWYPPTVYQAILLIFTLLVMAISRFFLISFCSDQRRARFNDGPMGLSRTNTGRPHYIVNIQPYNHLDDWMSSLRRGPKRTLRIQVDASRKKHYISVKSFSIDELSWREAFSVVWDHQHREINNPVVAFILAFGRTLVGKLMFGWVDAYYAPVTSDEEMSSIDENETVEHNRRNLEMVAFSISIVKGETIRAMWFYQRTRATRWHLWFATLRTAVSRAISMPQVHVVDLGPSFTKAGEEVKSQYGFVAVADWEAQCRYGAGPYATTSDYKYSQ